MSTRQYVVLNLDEQKFGIDIMNVKEIIPYQESIGVPDTPDFIEGITNYRGNVIPVISLKKRFKLGEEIETEHTRIIVISLGGKEIGFIVDEASQTVTLEQEQIDPAPEIIVGVDKKYIMGVGKIDEEGLLILIDLEEVLTQDEKDKIEMLEL